MKLKTAAEEHHKAKHGQEQACVRHNAKALAAKGKPAYLDVTTAVTVTVSACLNIDCIKVTSKAHEGRFRGSLSPQERRRDPPLLAVLSVFFTLHKLAAPLAAVYAQCRCCMGVSVCVACQRVAPKDSVLFMTTHTLINTRQ